MNAERLLDRALAGNAGEDPEIDSLVAVASELDRAFAVDPERWSRERALFVAGVAAKRRRVNVGRFFVPALAMLLVVAVAIGGRFALPGDALYPVRQVLQSMGLAPSIWTAADKDIARATRLVTAAEAALVAQDLFSAEEAASAAIARLDDALEELEGLTGDGKVRRVLEITALQERAREVIADVEGAEPSDRGPDPGTVGPGRKHDDEDDEDDDGDDATDTGGGDPETGNATDGDEAPDEATFDGDDTETFDGDDDVVDTIDDGGDDGDSIDAGTGR